MKAEEKVNTIEDLAVLIRRTRMARGWKASDLSQKANVAGSTVSFLESARRVPTLPTLIKIMVALDLDFEIGRRVYHNYVDAEFKRKVIMEERLRKVK